MRTLALTCLLYFGIGMYAALAAESDIQISTVIGTEFQGKYKHPTSIAELDNGDLLLAYYGGSGEYEDDSKVWAMRMAKGSTTWTTPEVIADTPFLGEGNPVLFQAPDGIVWLFYVQRGGNTWSDSRVRAKISKDGAHTWSDSINVSYEMGTMVQGKPIALKDGDYLLPAYHETGHDQEFTPPDTCSYFFRIHPKTGTWEETNRITSKYGNMQPEPVQITDDYLIAYCRRAGSFDPIPDGRLVRTESRDGGRTWSAATESQFPNPNAACSFIKLQNGHLLLVYNDSIEDRYPLTATISPDNDKTYAYKRNIGLQPTGATFQYPVAMQAKDGMIHVTCTTDERTRILHFVFSEDAILKHPVSKQATHKTKPNAGK